MSAVINPPELDIEYPEGELVPEAAQHSRRRREIVTALEGWLAGRDDADRVAVCDNMNIYYRPGDVHAVVAPDVAVAFDVDAGGLATASSYRVWEFGGPPAFVLEIASPSTSRTDEVGKPARYAAMGVAEYWRLDPHDGELLTPPLQGARRAEGRWRPITVAADDRGALRGASEALGLDLCWQAPRLRLYDPAAGAWLRDQDDLRAAETQAQARADRQQARADRAEAEAAELRRRLRQHEPPAEGPAR